ncbi:hypothetical protein MSG28_005120, partial [Choristoneura fumiferana]
QLLNLNTCSKSSTFSFVDVSGLSGIFKGRDYLQGLWECPPYNHNSMRSVYHVRSLDVFRLSQLKDKVHVMLSHDWPVGITDFGDKENLLRRKPFFREDIESNQLGSPPAMKLLKELKPEYWFAAHLHCQFSALVKHDDSETKFLALDKCLPKRRHLQILDLPEEYDGDKQLKYDEEWLAVLRNTNHLLSVKNVDSHLPGPGGNERFDFTQTSEEKETIIQLMGDMLYKADSFVKTAPKCHFNLNMKIAVEGCAHGELEKIYECIETLQEREEFRIDLLICCGDFQSVRNKDDLLSMAVPEKYQNICTFYKYYSGEKQAPVLTIFIGGNHEASNYLQELPYGGWVCLEFLKGEITCKDCGNVLHTIITPCDLSTMCGHWMFSA